MSKVSRAQIEAYLRASADDDNDGEFSKSELDKLFLDKVGFSVNEEVLTNMFLECDLDSSGAVTFDELVPYIERIEKPQLWRRVRSTILSTVTSKVVWCLAVAFLFSFTILIVDWIRDNVTGNPLPDTVNWGAVVGFGFVVGCLGFLFIVYDEFKAEVMLVDRAEEKVKLWAMRDHSETFSSNGYSNGYGSTDGAFKEDSKMTLLDLKTVLEKSSVFLSRSLLEDVFSGIDTDKSGYLSFQEVKEHAHALEKRGPLVGWDLEYKVMEACFSSLVFWMTLGYEIGSFLFWIGAYVVDEKKQRNIFGWASLCFVVGSLGLLYLDVTVKNKFVASVLDLRESLLNMQKQFDDKASGKFKKENSSSALFHAIDSGGDGNLDFVELYNALTDTGFVVDLKVLKKIFRDADTNGNGKLQLSEFITYMDSSTTKRTVMKRTKRIFILCLKDEYFYNAIVQITAGVMFCFVYFAEPFTWVLDMASFAASWMYLFAGLHLAICAVRDIVARYDAMESAKFMFKEKLLRGVMVDLESKGVLA